MSEQIPLVTTKWLMVGKNAVSVTFLVNDKPIINVELLPGFNELSDEAKQFLVSSIRDQVQTIAGGVR